MIIWLQFSIPSTVATSISSSHNLLSFCLTFFCDPSLFIFTSSYSATVLSRKVTQASLLPYTSASQAAICFWVQFKLLVWPLKPFTAWGWPIWGITYLWLHLLIHQIQKEWHSVGPIYQETTFDGPEVAGLLCHGICLTEHYPSRCEVSSIHPYGMEVTSRHEVTSLSGLGYSGDWWALEMAPLLNKTLDVLF